VSAPAAYDPSVPTRRQRAAWGHGLISIEGGYVRVDFPYTPASVEQIRPLCWRYGGGFRIDASGTRWIVGLAGIRAVIRAFPGLVVTKDAQAVAREQAWTA
jgi:hypothetical protein